MNNALVAASLVEMGLRFLIQRGHDRQKLLNDLEQNGGQFSYEQRRALMEQDFERIARMPTKDDD